MRQNICGGRRAIRVGRSRPTKVTSNRVGCKRQTERYKGPFLWPACFLFYITKPVNFVTDHHLDSVHISVFSTNSDIWNMTVVVHKQAIKNLKKINNKQLQMSWQCVFGSFCKENVTVQQQTPKSKFLKCFEQCYHSTVLYFYVEYVIDYLPQTSLMSLQVGFLILCLNRK